MLGCLGNITGSGFTLRANHGRTLCDATKRLAEVRGATNKRNRELGLVDVVNIIRRRQHFRLVDVVDFESFEHLGFNKVTNSCFRHHGNLDLGLDRVDEVRVAHSSNSALCTDVGWDTLERHNSDRACVLGNSRLFSVDDIHDDTALEHLCETALDPQSSDRNLSQSFHPLWMRQDDAENKFMACAARHSPRILASHREDAEKP